MARVPDLARFCAAPRPGDGHGRGPHPLPDEDRAARRSGSPRRTCRRAWASSALYAYRSDVTHEEHLALVHGEIARGRAGARARPLAVPDRRRLRLRALRLRRAARARDGEDRRGGPGRLPLPPAGGARHRPVNKLKAYELQDQGHDTVAANEKLGFPPDIRNYGVGCQILRDLGVRKMRLMTNNPSKYVAIDGYGLEIVERVPLEVHPTDRSPQVPRGEEEQDGAPAQARLEPARRRSRARGASIPRMTLPMPAAVLAGGASRRMGRPKAALAYGARDAARVPDGRLAGSSKRFSSSPRSRPPSAVGTGARRLDRVPEHAAIHGLSRALEEATRPDLRSRGRPARPCRRRSCARSRSARWPRTRAAVVPRADGRLQPLAAVWRALRPGGDAAADRRRASPSLQELAREVGAEILEEAEWRRLDPSGIRLREPEHARAVRGAPGEGMSEAREAPAREAAAAARDGAAAAQRPPRRRARAGAHGGRGREGRDAARGRRPRRRRDGRGGVRGARRRAGSPRATRSAVARLAGIQAAKRTSEIVPLCHPLALESVEVDVELATSPPRGGRDGDRPHHRKDRRRDGGPDRRRRRLPRALRHDQGARSGRRRSGRSCSLEKIGRPVGNVPASAGHADSCGTATFTATSSPTRLRRQSARRAARRAAACRTAGCSRSPASSTSPRARSCFPPRPGTRAGSASSRRRREVPFAGHPNVGTAFVLARVGRARPARPVRRRSRSRRRPASCRSRSSAARTARSACELAAPERLSLGRDRAGHGARGGGVALARGRRDAHPPPRSSPSACRFSVAELARPRRRSSAPGRRSGARGARRPGYPARRAPLRAQPATSSTFGPACSRRSTACPRTPRPAAPTAPLAALLAQPRCPRGTGASAGASLRASRWAGRACSRRGSRRGTGGGRGEDRRDERPRRRGVDRDSLRSAGAASAAPRVHLEVRILLELASTRTSGERSRERRAAPRRRGRRGTPGACDQGRGSSSARRPARSGPRRSMPARRVEAQVPEAVGGQPAAVAGAAEGRRRRGDDAEDGPVRRAGSARRAPRSPRRSARSWP